MNPSSQEQWTAEQYRHYLATKQKPATKNKYGAVRAEWNGRKFDSTGERDYAVELDLRKQSGEIKKVQYQYKIVLEANGQFVCNYYIDFRLVMADGSIVLAEFKGKELPDFKIKWAMVKTQLSDIEPNATLWLVKKQDGQFVTVETFKP